MQYLITLSDEIMRMLDVENKSSVWNLQPYLTESEARELHRELAKLLVDPEANEHFHVNCRDSGRELSCSIITPAKIARVHTYTRLEQRILTEK